MFIHLKKNKVKGTFCSELWRRMYIWWDGVANPCEVDFKSMLQLGKIKLIQELVHFGLSKIYKDLRSKHTSKSRGDLDPIETNV